MPRILRSAHVYLIVDYLPPPVARSRAVRPRRAGRTYPGANYTPGALVLASVGQIGPMITTHRAGKMKIARGKMSFS
jgi:hypothetical protein